MDITVTPSAAKHFRGLMEEYENTHFRLSILPGGCSGFQYMLEPSYDDSIEEDDLVIDSEGIQFLVDPFSEQYLDGILIHYRSDMMGSGFYFDNPNATGGCGCGSSFTV